MESVEREGLRVGEGGAMALSAMGWRENGLSLKGGRGPYEVGPR